MKKLKLKEFLVFYRYKKNSKEVLKPIPIQAETIEDAKVLAKYQIEYACSDCEIIEIRPKNKSE